MALGADYLVSELDKHAQQRLKQKAEEQKTKAAYSKAIKTGVKVCLEDSLAGGNCQAGTEEFCRRHKLDIKKYYSPLYLLRFNDNVQRVRLAINAAIKRHMRFIDAGAELFYP